MSGQYVYLWCTLLYINGGRVCLLLSNSYISALSGSSEDYQQLQF